MQILFCFCVCRLQLQIFYSSRRPVLASTTMLYYAVYAGLPTIIPVLPLYFQRARAGIYIRGHIIGLCSSACAARSESRQALSSSCLRFQQPERSSSVIFSFSSSRVISSIDLMSSRNAMIFLKSSRVEFSASAPR